MSGRNCEFYSANMIGDCTMNAGVKYIYVNFMIICHFLKTFFDYI